MKLSVVALLLFALCTVACSRPASRTASHRSFDPPAEEHVAPSAHHTLTADR